MPSKTAPSSGIWLSHPTGNANVKAVAEALMDAGILDAFHTCIGIGEDNTNPLLKRLFAPRRCPIPDKKLHRQAWREMLRLGLPKIPGLADWLWRHETGPLSIDQVYQHFDRNVARKLIAARKSPKAIYAYEDCALESFRAARQSGICRIYDLPIGYWRVARRIQREESELKPEWAATMPALIDSEPKLARKEAELEMAEHILVASQFTADTLKEAPFSIPKPTIIPYGCPNSRTSIKAEPSDTLPLRILYVGSMSQRKGISYLLEAVEALDCQVELTLIGSRVGDCAPLDAALKRYRWIPKMPHHEILEQMHQHDVFVLPSLFEGFGLVITEALSQGMAVIATPHTCAPDIITDGIEGFIIPIRDAVALRDKLSVLAQDRCQLMAMKEAALQRAHRQTWSLYQAQLTDAVTQAIHPTS